MKFTRESLLLYAVTDRSWLQGRELTGPVCEALEAGATFIQLREKNLSENEFTAEAIQMKKVVKPYSVPFVINDNLHVAMACDADGVHIGQSDTALAQARAMLGPDKIIGVSVQTVEQAIEAERGGADYLGVGAVFSTSTKKDAAMVSHQTLQAICAAVSIPVVAIGGIGPHNALNLRGSGVDGIAVISAIFAQPDLTKATKKMRELAQEVVKL